MALWASRWRVGCGVKEAAERAVSQGIVLDPFKKLKNYSCDRAGWDDPTGRAKGQQRWREASRGGKGAAAQSLHGRSLEGEDAEGQGWGCKGNQRRVSTQLCARAIQSFRIQSQPSPGMSVLFPPLQSSRGFPAGAIGDVQPATHVDVPDTSLIPGLERFPRGRKL